MRKSTRGKMANLSLTETQAIAELADKLYSFLPGSGAVYTWREAAQRHGVDQFWIGGSKLPAITALLEATFEHRRSSFCDLVLTAVREGMKYRIKKQDPVKREEIEQINALVLRLQIRIPELHDRSFLATSRLLLVQPLPPVLRRLNEWFLPNKWSNSIVGSFTKCSLRPIHRSEGTNSSRS